MEGKRGWKKIQTNWVHNVIIISRDYREREKEDLIPPNSVKEVERTIRVVGKKGIPQTFLPGFTNRTSSILYQFPNFINSL